MNPDLFFGEPENDSKRSGCSCSSCDDDSCVARSQPVSSLAVLGLPRQRERETSNSHQRKQQPEKRKRKEGFLCKSFLARNKHNSASGKVHQKTQSLSQGMRLN